jgi:hypothetical protein
MLKAGLILGGVALVLGTIGAFVFPLICVPCVALLAGIGAGYLAGQFDKPGAAGTAAQKGAGAGAIGGVGALLAHLIGGVSNAFLIGPEGASDLLRDLGLDVGGAATDPATYYISAFGSACCLGLFEVALMAGVGALGGFLWYQMTGSKSTPAAPAM